MKKLSRRDLLIKTSIGATSLLIPPNVFAGWNLEKGKDFASRQWDKWKSRNQKKIEIPHKEAPEFKIPEKNKFETLSIETGVAELEPILNGLENDPTKFPRIDVASRFSRATTNNDDVDVFKLEFKVKDYDNEKFRKKEDYGVIRNQRNINCSQSYLWIAHPLFSPGTQEFVRIVPLQQNFYAIKGTGFEYEGEWKEGKFGKDNLDCKITYKVGEEILDGFLRFIAPTQKEKIKKSLEKVVKWSEGEKDYLYQEQGKNYDSTFIVEQLEIKRPGFRGYNLEAMEINFAMWNPGEDINFKPFGNIFLGDSSIVGGFVKNWELKKGRPVFSY